MNVMEMTDKELEDYGKLSRSEKEDFDYYATKHPDWSFEQLLKQIIIIRNISGTMRDGGKDVNPNDPSTWKTILEGVKTTLSKFKSIGSSVFNAIDEAIVKLKGFITAGIQRIGNVIDNLWNEIF